MAETQLVSSLELAYRRRRGYVSAGQPDNKRENGRVYPVSTVADVEKAVEAAAVAAEQIAEIGDEIVAQFLERFADRIEARGTKFARWPLPNPVCPSRRGSKILSCRAHVASCVRRRKPCASAPGRSPLSTQLAVSALSLVRLGAAWPCLVPTTFPSLLTAWPGAILLRPLLRGIPLLVKQTLLHRARRDSWQKKRLRCRGDGYARRNCAADLSHGPRGWQTSGVASQNRRNGLYRIAGAELC